MRVSIHQPEFFPWAGFFNKVCSADRTVILDNVEFKKNYFENRCRIKINGQSKWLTVPVLIKNLSRQKISAVRIDNNSRWGTKIWKTLNFNYAKSPYWSDFEDFLNDTFIERQWDSLIDLNCHALNFLCDYLNIQGNFVFASTLNTEERGSRLILEICKKMSAKTYLSGQFGKDYLEPKSFQEAGITLEYQDYSQPAYQQFNGPYVGPLSILDAVLNLGQETLDLVRWKGTPEARP